MKSKKSKKIRLPMSIKKLFPQVTSAVDADKPVEVSVNPEDCKSGKKLNPAECALARAAKRELKADGVIIGVSTSYVIRGREAVRFSTPMSVQKELVSFDRNQDFAPGEYYLQPKAPSNRFGEYQSENRNRKGYKKPRRKIHTTVRVRVLAKGAS